MPIEELRILPPLAIGRLGAANEPLEAFDLEVCSDNPLDYRKIVPQPTLLVDEISGEITRIYTPERIRFKDDKKRIRPVAPFLEVFARTSENPDELVPLTIDLLERDGLALASLHWGVEVGNIKIFRRTNDPNDKIIAEIKALRDNKRYPLLGLCANFLPGRTLPLGWVQFIKPTTVHPAIRLRFTPAGGKVYGSSLERYINNSQTEPDPIINDDALVLYDEKKGKWRGYRETTGPMLTNPGGIFAGYNDGDSRVSWGYLDDECDGYVRLFLKRHDGSFLCAQSHIGAGPPTFAPDTLPIRVVSDELEQILYGPTFDDTLVPIEEAEDLIRRALETVRHLNTMIMNGNSVNGRLRVASTMAAQDTNDFSRYYEPIAATSLVDNLALRSLHQRVFSALSAGGAPWFSEVLRKPEEIGDLSDKARRKMPMMMRGADGRGLTLTRRQIDLVIKASLQAMFQAQRTLPSEEVADLQEHTDE